MTSIMKFIQTETPKTSINNFIIVASIPHQTTGGSKARHTHVASGSCLKGKLKGIPSAFVFVIFHIGFLSKVELLSRI